MAISLVGAGLSGTNINGGNVTITFPSSYGVLQDDIVVVMGGHGNTGTAPAVNTSGYTSLVSDTNNDSAFNASYKRMGVSPDTLVTCNGGGDSDDAVAYLAYIFRGVSTATAVDATAVSAHVTGDPNSPSITTVTNGAAVVTCWITETQFSATINPPTSYANKVSAGASDIRAVTVGAAWRALSSSGTENPGVWDTSVNPTASGVSATLAFRPQGAGTFGEGALSATGTVTPTFVGPNEIDGQLSITATGSAAWVGQALAITGALSATGTASATFVGTKSGDGDLSATGTWTITWVGDKEYMSSVREVIESKGAASVTVS